MSLSEWIRAGIDLILAVVSGVFVGVVIYWLDEKRAKREQKLEYFKIASSWSKNKEKPSMRGFDFEDANLAGKSFQTADLEDAHFKNSELESVDMSGANLTKANLTSASLSGAKLTDIEAYNANFSKTKISIDIYREKKSIPDFSEARLNNAKFKGVHFQHVTFHNAKLASSDFSRAVLENCDFTGTDLTDSKWKKVKRVENCIWKNVTGATKENFPEKLLKEIDEQNAE